MMNVLYTIKNSIYVNITNRCPCNCSFCLRKDSNEVEGSGSLWLDREPTLNEIIENFRAYDLERYEEVVFCGFGEPLERLDIVVKIGKYIKENNSKMKVRLNTNGLGDLINNKNTAKELKEAVDSISISLNAPTKEEYFSLCKPKFGIESFNGLIIFAENAKKEIGDVQFSIVDILDEIKIQECKKIAKRLNIKLRIREKIVQS